MSFENNSEFIDILNNSSLNSIFKNTFKIENGEEFILPNLDNFEESSSLYLETDLFSNYLSTIISSFSYVNEKTVTSNLKDDFLEINFESLEYRISNELFNVIHHNLFQISVLPIRLLFPYPILTAHSNVIIINPFLKTIELFEPHGYEFLNQLENITHPTSLIPKIFKELFKEFENFTFINSSQICLIGPQLLQNSLNKTGHCLAWSLLFVQLRLIYIYKTNDWIINELTKFSPILLDSYIKKYITFLESIKNLKKDRSSFNTRNFRHLLSLKEIELEDIYLPKLIQAYFTLLKEKINIIDNDISNEDCVICEIYHINNKHTYCSCPFNNTMQLLNKKIQKAFQSINGYKNTPHFDENFYTECQEFFLRPKL